MTLQTKVIIKVYDYKHPKLKMCLLYVNKLQCFYAIHMIV